MKNHRKRILFFASTLIFVMACRIYGCGSTNLTTLDNHTISCSSFQEGISYFGYSCTFPCPNGSNVTVDLPDTSVRNNVITYSLEFLQQKYCPAAPPATEEPTEEPTQEPTEEPTAPPTDAPTDAPLEPYLTGDATFCNLTDRFINFTIAENAPDVSASSLNVTLGGQPLKCNVPASNPGILTCTFQPGTSFPAQVSLSIDGSEVNNFSFDGGICVYSDPPPPTDDVDPPNPCEGVLTPTPSCP